MKKRLISSVFIVAFTLAFVLLKQVHALFFDAFALLISYVSLREIIKAQGERAVEKSTQIALYLVPAAQFSIYFFASGYLALVLHMMPSYPQFCFSCTALTLFHHSVLRPCAF